MNRSPHASDRRGSALLIVLGLLGFLMISAVAFAISMRTERAAASSYRRGLQARELLEIAFTNARIALQYHMENQADGLDPANPSTRTVERLAPFRYDGDSSTYGRLISSTRSSSSADDSIAYLLDDAVLRHIPPAFAYPVYETLEMDAPPNGSGEVHAGAATNPGAYNIDRAANWQPIDVDIPVVKGTTIATGNVADDVQTATVGRMAWAIVNLSDALDINAVGSTSQRRGIGLTGSEFAFGSISSANASQDDFDLLPSQADATEVGLPTFASGADLATYAARVDSASELTRETKGIFPYSWESALNEGGEGPFSPFTVYGFWPNEKRENESGARRHDSNSGSGSTTVIACNDVDEQMLTAGCEVETLVRETLGVSSTVGTSLARLLRDYVDTDSKPGEYDTAYDQDLYNNAIPTVENVPMLSEVAYLQDGWEDSGKIASDIQKAVKELFEGKTMKGSGSITTQSGLLKTFETEEDLSLTFPEATLKAGLRAYWPGREESTESYTAEPEGIGALFAAASVDGSALADVFPTAGQATDLKAGGAGLAPAGGSEQVFEEGAAELSFTPKALDLDGAKLTDCIGVRVEQNGSPTTVSEPKEITLTFLVDFLFRVKIANGSDVVDLAPVGVYDTTSTWGASKYPTDIVERFNQNGDIREFDLRYFRVTRPVEAKVKVWWEAKAESKNEGGATTYTYTATSKLDGDPTVRFPVNDTLKFDDAELKPCSDTSASCQVASYAYGTWYAIDPRYNWLPPMMGSAGAPPTEYGSAASTARPNFSSPHWLFLYEGQITSGTDQPSDVQKDYATANDDLVPFVWGLNVEDIRYGYNDCGQLLLPAEIGFLPLPLDERTWHPNINAYNTQNISTYYTQVGRASYFRTVPVTDFNDGAFTGSSLYSGYDQAIDLTTMFDGFSGKNFPEEHRGIVSVFAGMDDYPISQRIKQFAMMGIPSSIKQAAKVSYERLESAASIARVPDALVTEDLKVLGEDSVQNATLDTEAKYDVFIRDYLFPIPTSISADTNSWRQEYPVYVGGPSATPTRPKTIEDAIVQSNTGTSAGASLVDKMEAYNTAHSSDKLGQNDLTTLVAIGKECFGDRQQLFLFILRADSIAYNSGRDLSQHRPLATARAVALVWRDAYGELPDRLIYWQLLP